VTTALYNSPSIPQSNCGSLSGPQKRPNCCAVHKGMAVNPIAGIALYWKSMPVSFLTDNERERLQRCPAEISSGDITAFFTLSATDLALVRKQRGAHNRLGFAFQLCILRYLGFSLDDLMQIPEAGVTYVSQQLHVDPSSLKLYGNRQKTRSEHLQEIQPDSSDLFVWLVFMRLSRPSPVKVL
jgi:Domain of unknown function (DUF4158)